MRSHSFASHKSTFVWRWGGRGQAAPKQQAHPVVSECQPAWVKQLSLWAAYRAQCYLLLERTALWARQSWFPSKDRWKEVWGSPCRSILSEMSVIHFVGVVITIISQKPKSSSKHKLWIDIGLMENAENKTSACNNAAQHGAKAIWHSSLSFYWIDSNINIQFDLGVPPEFFVLFMSVFLKHLKDTKICFR